jgi:hypothetical protein
MCCRYAPPPPNEAAIEHYWRLQVPHEPLALTEIRHRRIFQDDIHRSKCLHEATAKLLKQIAEAIKNE